MTIVWLANPVLGGCQNTDYAFEEADMILLMESLNQQNWTVEQNQQSYEIELNIFQAEGEQASNTSFDFTASAHACGTRSFLASADACISDTMMPLEGFVTIRDSETREIIVEEQALEGEMYVIGYELSNAEISLSFSEAGSIDFYSADGLSFALNSLTWRE